jgi:hypothetical protein
MHFSSDECEKWHKTIGSVTISCPVRRIAEAVHLQLFGSAQTNVKAGGDDG